MPEDRRAGQRLPWDACYNARDLGGYPTADGGRTRWGALVRADTLARLTPAGCAALRAYGIGTIIDLRHPSECARDPSPLAASPAVTHRALPLTDEANRAVQASIAAAPTVGAQYRLVLETGAPGIAAVMRAIATAPDTGVLFFCHAGKDRTGLIAALLLALAGVAPETIVADYLLSETHLAPLRARGQVRLSAVPEAMRDALSDLDTRYGGSAAYLEAAGVGAGEIERLRARLRSDGKGEQEG